MNNLFIVLSLLLALPVQAGNLLKGDFAAVALAEGDEEGISLALFPEKDTRVSQPNLSLKGNALSFGYHMSYNNQRKTMTLYFNVETTSSDPKVIQMFFHCHRMFQTQEQGMKPGFLSVGKAGSVKVRPPNGDRQMISVQISDGDSLNCELK